MRTEKFHSTSPQDYRLVNGRISRIHFGICGWLNQKLVIKKKTKKMIIRIDSINLQFCGGHLWELKPAWGDPRQIDGVICSRVKFWPIPKLYQIAMYTQWIEMGIGPLKTQKSLWPSILMYFVSSSSYVDPPPPKKSHLGTDQNPDSMVFTSNIAATLGMFVCPYLSIDPSIPIPTWGHRRGWTWRSPLAHEWPAPWRSRARIPRFRGCHFDLSPRSAMFLLDSKAQLNHNPWTNLADPSN